MADRETDSEEFGFRAVPRGEKARLVRGVFSSVARRYDLMNDLLSGGVHRAWKMALLDRLAPQPGQRLLDLAGGTGDVALGFLKRASERKDAAARAPASAVICDISAEMLAAGVGRRAPFEPLIDRVCGDAERLPFPDRSFDAATLAFGLRNMTNRAAALAETLRVLKTGARFICLEFSRPTTEGLRRLYDAYSFNVIPRLGAAAAGDADSYRYLVESIRRFPPQQALVGEIEQAGFRRVTFENLSGGVAALHMAWRI